MIELEGLRGVDVALERFVDNARKKGYGALFKAGNAVAKDAQRQGSRLHGPMHVRPKVAAPDGDTVTVGYGAVRPQTRRKVAKMLETAKNRNWPRSLR